MMIIAILPLTSFSEMMHDLSSENGPSPFAVLAAILTKYFFPGTSFPSVVE